MTRALLLFLVLAAGLPVCESKTQASSVKLGGLLAGVRQRWVFLAKFGFATGTGSYKIRLRLNARPGDAWRPSQNVTLQFESYLDEDWPAVEPIEDHCNRSSKARKVKVISVPPDGRWSDYLTGTVKQNVRSHVWYYSVSDCETPLEGGVEFDYEVEFLQQGSSHFGVEQRWTLPANVLSLLCFFLFVVSFAKQCYAELQSAGKLHAVIWALATVVGLQLAAQALHALHLWRYSFNGTGIRAVEIFAEILFILSQLVQSTLLILIGLGYTLIPVKITAEMVVPAVGFGAVIHVALVALSKNEDGAADKFHDYDGLGKVLLAIRLLLFACFLWAVCNTRQGAGLRLRNFLNSFGLAGTLYFLGPPMVVLIVNPFAPYLRPPILTTSFLCLQIGTNLWLHSLFLSRAGEYFKVSELNASQLPGGTPRGTPRGENQNKYD